MKKRTTVLRKKLEVLIMALAIAVAVALPMASAQAASGAAAAAYETGTDNEAADETLNSDTASTKKTKTKISDGLHMRSNGYYYVYKNGSIRKKTGWLKVSSTLSVKLDSKYRVVVRVGKSGGKKYISTYNRTKKKFVRCSNRTVTLSDNMLHYALKNGQLVSKAGTVSNGKGTTYILGSRGVVKAKLVKKGQITKYLTYDSESGKWTVLKDAYRTVDGVLYYFKAGSGIATRMFDTSTSKYSKYNGQLMKLVRKDISTINSNLIYYFNGSGRRVKTEGWYTLAGGTKVYVCSKGYVKAKLSAYGKSYKYSVYDYSAEKWVTKKSTWKTVGSMTYYFGSNGVAQLRYSSKSRRLQRYSNGKFTTVKKAVSKLDDGKLYYFGAKGTKVTKTGWYVMSDTEKVYVGSKGYVTMKFQTEAGKLLKYDYTAKKWIRLREASYKIGSKTYYFDSDGIMVRNAIWGNDKTGYFYIDQTGCKVTSKEIQMSVDFVKEHTDDTMTQEEKLKECFTYLSRNYPYLRDYTTPTDASKFSELCIDMLTNNHGNCYRCAATFACVATVLGYEARVTCGKVTNLQGTGLTIHGWTELWSEKDKQWIVYDVSMQRNWPKRDYYHVYIDNYYPTNREIGPRARLTVKNGKVSWRWLKDSELSDH